MLCIFLETTPSMNSTITQLNQKQKKSGTHLILPPCVSLGGQNISRFASPKNLRLMNSIRESCRSIEELDLGRNKLSDLIEIYKILQCTPNLKFLNLSQNDLSRTAPVAMAANCPSSSISASSSSTLSSAVTNASTANGSSSVGGLWASPGHPAPSSTISLHNNNNNNNSTSSIYEQQANNSQPSQCQRNYLTPINQNSGTTAANFVGCHSRRHSTLGASSNKTKDTNNKSQGGARFADARRLAALAQSKKSSSSTIASRLVAARDNSCGKSQVARNTDPSPPRPCPSSARNAAAAAALAGCATNGSIISKTGASPGPTRTKSTMHLVRSLSSLSAKDVRIGSMSRKTSDLRESSLHIKNRVNSHQTRSKLAIDHKSSSLIKNTVCCGKNKTGTNKLFHSEPITETEQDVDMIEATQNESTTSTTSTGNNNQILQQTTGSNSNKLQQQQQNSGTTNPSTILGTSNKHQITGTITLNNSSSSPSSISSTFNTNHIIQQQNIHFKRTFESIKALALNNTGCQWRVVCSILSRMPNLEELHLSLNNYERIDLDPNQEFRHASLKRLYLCNNPKLTDWQELNKLLIAFPSLESLSIADCNISQIPENLAESREWRKICGLNINGWPIKEWPVIERLNELPSLIDLRCRNLEILSNISEPRDHLIARLPNLRRLNGSEIEERDQAEKAFLRFFVTNSHLERPRRFHELIQVHGLVDAQVDVDVDLSPPSQANVRVIYLNRNYYRENHQDDILMSEDFLQKLMAAPEEAAYESHLQITRTTTTTTNANHNNPTDNVASYVDKSNHQSNSLNAGSTRTRNRVVDTKDEILRLFKDESQEVVALDVDLRQSVRKFKQIVANIFGLNSQNFILYYIDHEMVGFMGPELIKHNQKKLWNYNVQDGDQFIVEEL